MLYAWNDPSCKQEEISKSTNYAYVWDTVYMLFNFLYLLVKNIYKTKNITLV